MKTSQLKALVKRGESEVLEFKTSTGSISTGMQTVCAFLNSDRGGVIIFGVKDNGQLIGQEVTDKTRKEIAVELSKIEPHAKIDVAYVKISSNRQAIVMLVNPGEQAPYTYDGRPYVRNQSTTTRMAKEDYMYLHNKNNPTSWEGLTNSNCTLRDLDNKRIKEVIREAIFEHRLPETARTATIPDILKKIGLIKDGKLTNAAVILFCKNEQKQFMQSYIKLARFRGIDKTSFIDAKMLKANAFDLYDRALDFLHSYLPVEAWIEEGNPIRVERPAIPYKVLREAVVNALVHRDYSHAGGAIDIAIYDDRVNISNIGALPKGVSLNQLSKEHLSVTRNPLIAHVFYLCGKIEKWGRGTFDMIKDCKDAGNPLPKYEERGGSFSVTLPLREPIARTFISPAPPIKLTDRQQKVLNILKQGPMNRKQILGKLKDKPTDRTVQRDLLALNKLGLIVAEGKARAISWVVVKN